MRGSYLLQATTDRTRFDVTIPAFSLDSPFQNHQLQ
jgi:uncharacterized protein affecting Mg2+/Co2+ transport